jgi:glycosyltransferase involved in cell wall biosynthesis
MTCPVRVRSGFGVNLFGYLTSHQSQGVIARNLLRTLRTNGVPVAVTDVAPDFGGTGADETECPTGIDEASAQPYPVTIFCFTPLDALDYVRRHRRLLRRDRLTAVVLFVEHRVIRDEFLPFLSSVDMVLVATEFIAEAVRSSLPGAICVPFPQSVVVPDQVAADKAAWGMAEDRLSIVTAFDTYSDSQRKNPVALVRAFQQAFEHRDDVELIMKIAHLDADAGLGGQALKALSIAADDPRIRVLDRDLSYAEVLSFFASADVVASLHRSEGLGLVLMEAMSVGTPVIATRYSGNLDFMTDANSVLIGSDEVAVATTYPGYQFLVGRDVWAEPRLEDAVAGLQRLADEPDLRRTLASQALADMAERRRQVAGGAVVEAVQDAIADPGLRRAHRVRRWAMVRHALRPRHTLGSLRHLVALRIKQALRLQGR